MTSTCPVLLVVGVGPGLGLSVAHRFGREGYAVALISRSSDRHPGYLHTLADAGIEAAAFAADASDTAQLRAAISAARERFGRIDVLWFGPGALDTVRPGDITALTPDEVRAMSAAVLEPAVDAVGQVLPEMRERGTGGLLFAGGASSVVPMPALGALALGGAALRNYALTLHAALADEGVHAGTLTIGGLIERGDIHTALSADAAATGGTLPPTLDPDELADTVWTLYRDRDLVEAMAGEWLSRS